MTKVWGKLPGGKQPSWATKRGSLPDVPVEILGFSYDDHMGPPKEANRTPPPPPPPPRHRQVPPAHAATSVPIAAPAQRPLQDAAPPPPLASGPKGNPKRCPLLLDSDDEPFSAASLVGDEDHEDHISPVTPRSDTEPEDNTRQ